MAGFMAGFGSAFSDSFNRTNDRIAQRKDDMFKMQYQNFISQKDKRDAIDSENAKNVKKAKQLVSMTGQPPETWSTAYEMLSSGIDDKVILEQLTNFEADIKPNTVAETDTSGPADPREELGAKAESSVNAQMQSSGMAPAPEGEGLFAGLKRRGAERDQNEINGRISQVTGEDVETVQQTMSGADQGTPIPGAKDYQISWKKKGGMEEPDKINTLEEAGVEVLHAQKSGSPERIKFAEDRFKLLQEIENDKIQQQAKSKALAEGTYSPNNSVAIFDKNRKFVRMAYPEETRDEATGRTILRDPVTQEEIDPNSVVQLNKRVLDRKDQITDAIAKPRMEYTTKVNNLTDGLRLTGEIKGLVDSDPRVLTNVANLAQTLQGAAREVYTGIDILAQTAKETKNFSEAGYRQMVALEGQIEGALGPGIESIAGKRAMLEAKVNLAAYRFAMMEGMSGREVSDKDFERFKTLVMNSSDPRVLQENLSSYVSGKMDRLRVEGTQVMNDNQQVIDFEKEVGFNPWGDVKQVDDYLNETTDPATLAGLEFVKGKTSMNTVRQPEEELPSWLPKDAPEAVTWSRLSKRGRELLEKKYGGDTQIGAQ